MSQPWIFMGGDRSHFTGKLRPAVRYKQIHYTERPPNGPEIMRRTGGVMFVPVLITPEGDTLQDTTVMIDALEERIPEPPLIPLHPLDYAVSRLFELFADEFFLMVDMRTRWGYPENREEVPRAFGAFAGALERGHAIADRMSAYVPGLGINDATIPAIDAHLRDLLDALDAHFAEHPFLLGDRMSLADCALMGPFYGHLYMDRVTRQLLYENAMQTCIWIERCNRPVPESMGAWFEGNYPPTLVRILELIGQDAAPILTAHGAGFRRWADGNARPGAEPDRYVGEVATTLRDVPTTIEARSFVAWKLQRLRAAANDLDEVTAGLRRWGCGDLLADPGVTLTKRHFRVIVDDG